MKTKIFYALHILLIATLAWAAGSSWASGRLSARASSSAGAPAFTRAGAAPGKPDVPIVPVSKAFNYQGVLREDGRPQQTGYAR